MANHGQALQLRNIRPEKTTAYTVRTENWVISDDQATAVSAQATHIISRQYCLWES
jgi:hypothetical protein